MTTCNKKTAGGTSDLGLDSLQASKRPGPRFVGLPMSREDQITLLIFAESLAAQHQKLLERYAGRPISCEIVNEVLAIVERAQFAARTEVLQALQGLEEVA